ncbi:MAG: phasin family protein [Pseudomonadota bacterium]
MPRTAPKSNGQDLFRTPIAPFDLEPMIAANQRGLQAVAEAQSHMFRRLTKMNSELFGFIDRRLERDREAAKELAGCKSPQEAVEVCARFTEAAIKDYSEEAGLIAGLYADQAREAMEDAQHQVETAIEPAKAKSA